ncbi:unnamed protein product [Lymnaea stagnalis]|uniref:Uncharacterized protein n=1 Tax=Lymnaea stagnalis TaxID=6523 RepID=A0AAV2IBC0_LYMST
MDLISLLLTFACMVTVSYATLGHICSYNSECDQGECCQILSAVMVVSKKRQLDWMTTTPGGTVGSCQLYQTEGSSCHPLDVLNGYCSCEPGTQCTEVEEPTTTTTTTTTTTPEPSDCSDPNGPTTPSIAKRTPGRPGYQWLCTA